jgi:hypothetical protein
MKKYFLCCPRDSQLGCRGTQICHNKVSGVPLNAKFTAFLKYFATSGAADCTFLYFMVWVFFFGMGATKLFFSPIGCRVPKKVHKSSSDLSVNTVKAFLRINFD